MRTTLTLAAFMFLWLLCRCAYCEGTPTLTKVTFSSHTEDYDKDANVAITVNVLLASDSRSIATADRVDGGLLYQSNSDHLVELLPVSAAISKADVLGFRVTVHAWFVGHGPWVMHSKVVLYFSDGTNATAECGNVRLDANSPSTTFQSTALQDLADRYAPQLMHPSDEPNLPANVEWFLPKTTLSFHNSQCPKDDESFGWASLSLLGSASVKSTCGAHVYTASGTRSASRSRTFLLSDVDDASKVGSRNPADWITYYHGYKNYAGGWTIQYWSFYAFNTGKKVRLPLGVSVEIGYHGGDWEMIAVVLGSDNLPLRITTTGHTQMESASWDSSTTNGTHPVMYTEKGGHEAHVSPPEAGPYIVHPTWNGAKVTGLGDQEAVTGPLMDLGSKLHPKADFLLYSGLWGSLGATEFSSGYWGPVFNETGMRGDGFLTAWCDGAADPGEANGEKRECFPDDSQ